MTTTTRKTRKAPWTIVLTALLAVLGLVFGVLTVATPAVADPDPTQVCAPLDSGKIDTTGDPGTVTITAPAGKLITGYCVKAGSANQGDGPVYVPVNPPVASLVISYPGGKAISNYSYSLGDAPVYYYTPSATARETVCTLYEDVWQQHTFGPVTAYGDPLTQGTEWTAEEKALADATMQPAANRLLLNEESDFDIDRTGEMCRTQETFPYLPTYTASATACTLVSGTWTSGYLFSVTVEGTEILTKDTPWTTSEKAEEDAKLQSQAEDELADLMRDATIDGTGASCTPPPTPGSQQFCVAPVGTTTFAYDTFGTTDNTKPQSTWTNGSGLPLSAYVTGTAADCTPPPPPPPTEPEPVAVVEPATVAVPAPATVPVPAKVTLPATIPAGEGPTVPTYVLALLVLGATALAVSTVHLVRTTR